MNNLYELERRYLASLLKGGEIQEITLTEKNEELHGKIKRERNERGRKFISPKYVDLKLGDYADGPVSTVDLANEIRDVRTKVELQDALKHLDMRQSAESLVDELGRRLSEIAAVKGKDRILTAKQLQAEPYDDVEFLVQDILPVGLTLLLGAPKQGKTWLLLLLAEVLSSGSGRFMWKNAKKVPVLYYSLEDGFSIVKNRLGILQSRWSDQLFIKERVSGTSGILRDIEETGARLVVVDTLGAYADMEDSSSYDETTRKMRELKQIASTCDVVIIVSHHTRKSSGAGTADWTQEGLGSQGIIGVPDCVMSLQRKRGEDTAMLKITGRAVQDAWMAIRFLGGIWERYKPEAK